MGTPIIYARQIFGQVSHLADKFGKERKFLRECVCVEQGCADTLFIAKTQVWLPKFLGRFVAIIYVVSTIVKNLTV